MKLMCSKQDFLRNRCNKMELIRLLTAEFIKTGIKVKQSHGDADVMICKVALELAENGTTVEVAGKDTDLLVILTYHWKEDTKMYFRTPQKIANGDG